jgi:hypothetical protein
MTAVALALHIFGAVVWVGGMFAIYVCLRPALNHGRIQKLARRALLTLGGRATTSQVIEWTCCRKRLLHGRRIERHDYRAARRALERIAARVGRGSSRGRPWIWRLRNE